jgi:hypothetical protein
VTDVSFESWTGLGNHGRDHRLLCQQWVGFQAAKESLAPRTSWKVGVREATPSNEDTATSRLVMLDRKLFPRDLPPAKVRWPQQLTAGVYAHSRGIKNCLGAHLVHCFTYIRSAAGGYFRLRQGVEGGAYPMRYVTTERRSMSRKEPRPRGLRRRELIGGVARRSRRAQAMLPPRALPLSPRRLNRASDISETVH